MLDLMNDPARASTGSTITSDTHLRFRCPRCVQKLRVRAIHAGRRVHCPRCDHRVRVPVQAGWGDLCARADARLNRRYIDATRCTAHHILLRVSLHATVFTMIGWTLGHLLLG